MTRYSKSSSKVKWPKKVAAIRLQHLKAVCSKSTRIHIRQVLDDFRTSNDDVYTFDATLSNADRLEVHKMCTKMGYNSRSSGSRKLNERRVTVYKPKGKSNKKSNNNTVKKNDLKSFTFTEEEKVVLSDFFSLYPPGDHGEAENVASTSKKNNDNKGKKMDSMLRKPLMKKDDVLKKYESVVARMYSDPKLKRITEARSKLPIASFKDVITSTIESHQVVLISGETGCGKTTQVPQYLMDYMWSKGETCKVVCTQPRRISAISVAERVSQERGENIGDSVGYKIRLETKGGRHSSVVFCTNGVLLRVLVNAGNDRSKRKSSTKMSKDSFPDITHIIVDEIHERDRFSDFMLTIIRDMLPLCPDLRVVLMSATLDAERFSQYFGGCPIIRVPGFTYDVKKFFLEDVLLLLDSNSSKASHLDCATKTNGDEKFELTEDNEGETALAWSEHENEKEASEILKKHTVDPKEENTLLDKYLKNVNPEFTDLILIEKLLSKICTESKQGAILVFLAGWDDINKARNRLNDNDMFNDSSKFLILALHSMIPSIEQKKVFQKPPRGCRKIIFSTNIAETAVTIDDVVFVIDSGRMKESGYDPYNKVSTLESSWISKASAKQREGRAGRCQAGICYHLYSKLLAASLAEFQVPEIKRTPIEELCLQVKLLDPSCKIEDFLKKTLDPPVSEAMHNAITVLQDIGALSADEELTELGEKLGSIPVHPLTSKMLLFAISMNCLDPALTLACANDYRDPFTLPLSPTEQKKAFDAKCELASLYGGRGDQLAVIAAFEGWKNAKQTGQESQFCSKYFVANGIMNMLFGMRNQLQNELHRNGFIPENSIRVNEKAKDIGVIHAVLVAGLYPKVGRFVLPTVNSQRFVIENVNGVKVRLQSQSVNSMTRDKQKDDYPLVIYDAITRGDGGLLIKNCTIVGPLPLLLLAIEIAVASLNVDDIDDENETMYEGSEDKIMSCPENVVKVIADRWLSFRSTALDVAQIYCLRERLSAAIMFKITHPGKDLPEILAASIDAISKILSYDGINAPLEISNLYGSSINIGEPGSDANKEQVEISNDVVRSLSVSQNDSQNHHNTSSSAPGSDANKQQVDVVRSLSVSQNDSQNHNSTSSSAPKYQPQNAEKIEEAIKIAKEAVVSAKTKRRKTVAGDSG